MFPCSSLQWHWSGTTQVFPSQTVPLGHVQPGKQKPIPGPITVSHLPRLWHFSSQKGTHAEGICGGTQGIGVVKVIVDDPIVGVVVGAGVEEVSRKVQQNNETMSKLWIQWFISINKWKNICRGLLQF